MKLIETIKIINNKFQHIDYHNQRLNFSRLSIWNCNEELDISKAVQLPILDKNTVYKCRIIYNETITQVEILPYVIRPISSLKIVFDNEIDYCFKYKNRTLLTQLFQQKENCDDILIIKNGLITDTYYCNIAFDDGQKWFTPASPLLRGTQRQYLLDEQVIFEKNIKLTDLNNFHRAKLFNAMINWKDAIIIEMEQIKP